MASSPVLLYDGVCGLCNGSVQFIIRHDPQKRIRFAALQSSYGKALLSRHPATQNIDSFVLVVPSKTLQDELVFVKSDAALQVALRLGGIWSLMRLGYILPGFLRDWVYDNIATRRYRWFGRYDTCPIPSPEIRSRFLDIDD